MKDERRINQKIEVEVREEYYEESSHFSIADNSEGGYIETDTVDFRPSTNKNISSEFRQSMQSHNRESHYREEVKTHPRDSKDTPDQ